MYYYYYLMSPVKFKLTFEEQNGTQIGINKVLQLQDFSSLLYDIDLLNDCIVLSTLKDYQEFNFSHYFFYRKGRPIQNTHKLYLNSISRNSPLSLEVIIPLAAAGLGIPWMLLQGFEKIRSWRLNHKKLELEVEKLKLDNQQRRIENLERLESLDNALRSRGADSIFESINRRFDKSNLIATDLEIYFSIDDIEE